MTLTCPRQKCANATWHGNAAVDQVIVGLRSGGPNLCMCLTSQALSERQDTEQPTTMSKKTRASTTEYFLNSILYYLLGAVARRSSRTGWRRAGLVRSHDQRQVQCPRCAALPQWTRDDPRAPQVPWDESCVGATHAWRASGHPHARPSSRPLQPSRQISPKLSSLITSSSISTAVGAASMANDSWTRSFVASLNTCLINSLGNSTRRRHAHLWC